MLRQGEKSKDKSKRRIRKTEKKQKENRKEKQRQKENKSFFALFLGKECADYFAPDHGEEEVFLDYADFRE